MSYPKVKIYQFKIKKFLKNASNLQKTILYNY